MLLHKVISLAVPFGVAVTAFLHAHAIGALVGATVMPASSIAPFAESRTTAADPLSTAPTKSADAILDRNPFDHLTGVLRKAEGTSAEDPWSAPPCEGVRAVVSVRGSDQAGSFAALDVRGTHVLQKRGGSVTSGRSSSNSSHEAPEGVTGTRVVYVAEDRVWLSRDGVLCQARVFGTSPALPTGQPVGAAGPAQTSFEKEIASKIVKSGPNEFQLDRSAIDRILEAQTELMRTPLAPEKDGDRVVGFRLVRIRPGSVLSTLGLETGDRLVSINGIAVTSTERMLEAYARLQSRTLDRLTLNVVRSGTSTNLDYVIR